MGVGELTNDLGARYNTRDRVMPFTSMSCVLYHPRSLPQLRHPSVAEDAAGLLEHAFDLLPKRLHRLFAQAVVEKQRVGARASEIAMTDFATISSAHLRIEKVESGGIGKSDSKCAEL